MSQSRHALVVGCVLCLVVLASAGAAALGPESTAASDIAGPVSDGSSTDPVVDGAVDVAGGPTAGSLNVSTTVEPPAAGVTPAVSGDDHAPVTVADTRTHAATAVLGPDVGTETAPLGERLASSFLEPIDDTVSRLESSDGGPDDGPLVPPGLVALVGYSRHDDSDPLEHDVRARVYDHVRQSPGTYPAAIVDRLGVPRSTVRYHLRILANEGLVTERAIDGRRRYVTAEATAAERTLAAVDDDSTAGAVVEQIARDGPATVSELAERLDRSPGTITHHLNRLEDAGVVDRERDGRAVRNRLAAEVGSLVASVSTASRPFAATTDD